MWKRRTFTLFCLRAELRSAGSFYKETDFLSVRKKKKQKKTLLTIVSFCFCFCFFYLMFCEIVAQEERLKQTWVNHLSALLRGKFL